MILARLQTTFQHRQFAQNPLQLTNITQTIMSAFYCNLHTTVVRDSRQFSYQRKILESISKW
jgi:hypothetical protein